MMDHRDNQVQDAFKRELPRMTPQGATLDDVIKRAGRVRVRRFAAVSVVAIVLSLALVVPILLIVPLGGEKANRPILGSRSEPATHLPSPSPGWSWRSNDTADVSIEAPESWNYTSDLLPRMGEPRVVTALGTGPIPAGQDCGPSDAIAALPSDGMLLWILEYTDSLGVDGQRSPYEFPEKGQTINLGTPIGPFECIGEKTNLVLFQEDGRYFQVHAMFGPTAPDSLRSEVQAALLSFTATSSQASSTDQCRTGGWTFCPEAAWTYEVVRAAHFDPVGDTGKAIIASVSGQRVEISAVLAGRPALGAESIQDAVASGNLRLFKPVSGIGVYTDGRRFAWSVHGLDVWLQSATHSASGVHPEVLNQLVTTSLGVMFSR